MNNVLATVRPQQEKFTALAVEHDFPHGLRFWQRPIGRQIEGQRYAKSVVDLSSGEAGGRGGGRLMRNG